MQEYWVNVYKYKDSQYHINDRRKLHYICISGVGVIKILYRIHVKMKDKSNAPPRKV